MASEQRPSWLEPLRGCSPSNSEPTLLASVISTLVRWCHLTPRPGAYGPSSATPLMKTPFPPGPPVSLLMRAQPRRMTPRSRTPQRLAHPASLARCGRLCWVPAGCLLRACPWDQAELCPAWPGLASRTDTACLSFTLAPCPRPSLSLSLYPCSQLGISAVHSCNGIHWILMGLEQTAENGPGSLSADTYGLWKQSGG